MFTFESALRPIQETKPFLIYLRHCEAEESGRFRPEAFVGFSRALRTSGFLATMPAEELKTLLYLLSFVTANGHIAPSAMQLAQAFHHPIYKTRQRLERLQEINWEGQPLIGYRRFESGLDSFVPNTSLFEVIEESEHPPILTEPLRVGGFREEIIAHSRQNYANPRAEVEAMVLAQMRPRQDSEQQQAERAAELTRDLNEEQRAAFAQLRANGLTAEQAAALASRFAPARIARQIGWLPYRNVHNPTGFLVAAIERDYEAPRGLPLAMTRRESQLQATEMQVETQASDTAQTAPEFQADSMTVNTPLADTPTTEMMAPIMPDSDSAPPTPPAELAAGESWSMPDIP